MFSSISLFPACALAKTTIRHIPGALNASMISFWYGARSVRQRPGSLLLSVTSTRFSSAHSLTSLRHGGRNISIVSWALVEPVKEEA